MTAPPRLVVCAGGGPRDPWTLPPSVDTHGAGFGGDRTMAELAVAASAGGIETEIRGAVGHRVVRELAAAAGAPVPAMGMGPRAPNEGDLVVIPDGWSDPADHARLALSPARTAILLMGPPGMFGWPFVERWEPVAPLEVSRFEVGKAEHYRAMRPMGFELWTTAPGVQMGLDEAGVPWSWIGNGQPTAFPDPPEKEKDVVWARNRWSPFAEEALDGLGLSGGQLPDAGRSAFLQLLGEARIFLLLMPMTGIARVFHEARAMGTVVITLRIDRFPDLYEGMPGVVAADGVEEVPRLIQQLLGDPARLEAMARDAMESVREELRWEPFVERVRSAVLKPPPQDPASEARAGFGHAIGALLDDIRAEAARRVAFVEEEHASFRRRRSVRLAAAASEALRRVSPRR